MRFFYSVAILIVIFVGLTALFLGLKAILGERPPLPYEAKASPIPPVVQLPPLSDASVPVQGFVPLEPVIPADLYIDRMRALRQACPVKFSVIGVSEGIFGECWDQGADERLWAEWIAIRKAP